MADCSKTAVFFQERQRMCDNNSCDSCLMHDFFTFVDVCPLFDESLFEEKYIDIVQQWSDEHPEPKQKTYADDFFEKFPMCDRDVRHNNVPAVCRARVYGGDCKSDAIRPRDAECEKCWNEPYKEGENDV